MALPIRNIINVSNVIENMPTKSRTFGKGLILTAGDTATTDRVRTYSSIEQVLVDFGSNTEVYKIASTYFANGYYGTPEFLYVGIYDSVDDASLEEALVAISDTQRDFYVFMPDSTFNDTQREAINDWVGASSVSYLAAFNDSNTDTIDTGVTTDLASVLKLANAERAFTVYETSAKTGGLDYTYAGIVGQMSTVDFSVAKRAITFSNKVLKNVVGEDLSNYQFMSEKNCGVYTQIKAKSRSLTRNIVMANGRPLYVMQQTDYIKEQIENALLDEVANRGSIPYTQAGLDIIASVITRKSQEFFNVGIIGAKVDGQTGELLSAGFKLTMPTISEIPSEDISNNVLNGVRVRYLLAGSIETVDITNYIQL